MQNIHIQHPLNLVFRMVMFIHNFDNVAATVHYESSLQLYITVCSALCRTFPLHIILKKLLLNLIK